MAAAITAAPWRVSREATQPIRSMLVSRSSFEKPSPLDRWVRTVSPSRYSTMQPRSSSAGPDEVRDRRLARAGQPREPEREAAAALAIRLGMLVRVDVLDDARGPARLAAGRCVLLVHLSLSVLRIVEVNAALQLVGAGPASRPLLLVRPGRAGAGNAADRAVADVVQRVVRNLVDGDVGLDALLVPVGEGMDAPDAVALRPLDLLQPGSARRLAAANARDPGRRTARARASAARPCGCDSSGRGRAPTGSALPAGAARPPR